MKKTLKMKWGLGLLALALISSSSFGFEALELNAEYPLAMGNIGQNFTSNPGFGAAVYFDRLLDPSIANFISVDYQSFTVKADGKTSFRVIPVMAGLEVQGKVSDSFFTTFGLAAGGALAYMNVVNPVTYSFNEYFMCQIKPGFEYVLGDSFSVVGRTPINFMIGRGQMTYAVFDIGLKFKLGGGANEKNGGKNDDKSSEKNNAQTN